MPTPARPTTFSRPLLASNTALVTCGTQHRNCQMRAFKAWEGNLQPTLLQRASMKASSVATSRQSQSWLLNLLLQQG